MQLTLRDQLTQFGHLLQQELFPAIEDEAGALGERAQQLVSVLAMAPLARFLPPVRGWMGRPAGDRPAIAAAFVAKAVYQLTSTRALIERLHSDEQLRRLCGWRHAAEIPHESTFSRAFAEFARTELVQSVHEALICETQRDRLVGHIVRDSTAIEARERFAEAPPEPPTPKYRAWGRKKSKARNAPRRPKTRIERQREMKLADMLAELPRNCSLGVKTSSDGNQKYWRGYKLHLDVADGQIPISAVLTGAQLHDSQVAIPLATMTAARVTSLYDVMDSAYDADAIRQHSRSLGHVPIIKPVKRVSKTRNVIIKPKLAPQFTWAEQERFRERTIVERVNARLKDEFGGRLIYVRGADKIMTHLMFGVLALTVDQLLRLAGG
jgi:hypothetical protein